MNKPASPNEITTEQIRKRLFFFLATALLALVLGIAITISLTLFDSLKNAEANSLVRLAEIRSLAISEWCRRAKDVARQITSRTRIRQELEKYNQGKISLQQLDQFTKPKLEDAMKLSDEVEGILRLDAKHRVVTRCGYGASLSLTAQERTKYNSDHPTIHEPLTIKNRTALIVSAPIMNRNGKRQGTDLVIIGLELLKRIITNPDDLGRTSEIVIGYASEDSILPLLPWKIREDHSPSDSDFLHVVRDYILKAINGKAGIIHKAGMALAYRPIEESDWGLIITQNVNELYFPLYWKMALIGGLTFLIYFVILFVFWFIMKPMAGRILLHTDELETKIQEKTAILEKEIVERKKAEKEKEEIITELQEAAFEIKTLSGLLPICSNCKKIRDDKGYWSQIESYISHHSEAEFSHSICPQCAQQLYPDLDFSDE